MREGPRLILRKTILRPVHIQGPSSFRQGELHLIKFPFYSVFYTGPYILRPLRTFIHFRKVTGLEGQVFHHIMDCAIMNIISMIPAV